MDFIASIIFYTGKLLFATILFVAMVVSTIISLPFIGAGLIKDAVTATPSQPERTNLIQFCS